MAVYMDNTQHQPVPSLAGWSEIEAAHPALVPSGTFAAPPDRAGGVENELSQLQCSRARPIPFSPAPE